MRYKTPRYEVIAIDPAGAVEVLYHGITRGTALALLARLRHEYQSYSNFGVRFVIREEPEEQ